MRAISLLFLVSGLLFAQQDRNSDTSKSGFVVEDLETNLRYSQDGTGERERVARIRVTADAAVRELGVLAFGYGAASEKFVVDYVRVRKPSGQVTETPASNFQEAPAPVTTAAPMYSDLRVTQIPVRGLARGDTLEYRIRWIVTKPEAPNQFWYMHQFQKIGEVVREALTVRVSAKQPLRYSSPEETPKITESSGDQIYSWTSSHHEATKEAEEGKEARDANDLNDGDEEPRPSVAITSFRSWEDLGLWWNGLAAERAAVTPAIRSKAEELTKGLSTKAEKVRAIYGFVSNRFRYISISFGVGRFQPHPAEQVLSDLYGDCKDKHTLLAALLKAAGIDAWPALVGAGMAFDSEVPSPAQFNHVITYIPELEGGTWLDSTPEVAPFGHLNSVLRGKKVLVVPTSGAASVREIPKGAVLETWQRFETTAVLNADGTLKGRIKVTSQGDDEVVLRGAFYQTPPGQWTDVVQGISNLLGFAGKVSDVDVDSPQVLGNPFRYEYTYTREKYSDWENLRIFPPLPGAGLPEYEKKPSKAMSMAFTGKMIQTARVTLPAGFSVEVPPSLHESAAFADFDSTYKVKDGVLTIERKLVMKTSKVAPAAWEEYMKLAKAVNGNVGQSLQLVRTEGTESASALMDDAKAAKLITEAATSGRSRNYAEARDLLAQAERINPKQRGLNELYAALDFSENRPDSGFSRMRREIAEHPRNIENYRTLLRAQFFFKRKADAIETLRTMVKIAPGDVEAARQLASLLLESKKFGEALAVAESGWRAAPDNTTIATVRAEALLRIGRKEEGLTAAKELLSKATDPTVMNNISYVVADTNVDPALAADFAKKAAQAAEERLKEVSLSSLTEKQLDQMAFLPMVWDTVGWALYGQGEYVKAVHYLEAAWQLGQHAAVADHLGQAYEKLGRHADAVHAWRTALAADGELGHIRERLAKEHVQPSRVLTREHKVVRVQSGEAVTAEELSRMRTVPVVGFSKSEGAGDFMVLLSSHGVDDVRFVSGPAGFAAAKDALLKTSFNTPFPDDGPEKVVRRGYLSCSKYTTPACQFTMLLPSSTKVE